MELSVWGFFQLNTPSSGFSSDWGLGFIANNFKPKVAFLLEEMGDINDPEARGVDQKERWGISNTNENAAEKLRCPVARDGILIDALQRLGISSHFEKEIDEMFSRIHNDHTDVDDLHFVALLFRLLRQHGYHLPTDIFGKFKDAEGNIKAILSDDVEGLLSLCEASYLSIPGKSILDDATR